LSRFRDDAKFYAENGAQILGISVDSIHSQRAFSERLGGLPFPLLPDYNREVFPKYSGFYDDVAGMKGVGKRAVYIVDKAGAVRYRWIADAPGQQPNYEEVKKAASTIK
jgi:glutaredoxin-dependent peroxiredoxin